MSDNRPESGTGTEAWPQEGSRLPRWRAAYVVGGVILAFSALIYIWTTTFEEVPRALSQGVQPTQFPRTMLIVIAILTVLMMIEASRIPGKAREPVPGMVFLTAGLLTVAVVAIHWVGIIAALIGVCVMLPILWGDRRYVPIAIFAIVFPILSFLLFSKVLEIRFPKGLVERLFY